MADAPPPSPPADGVPDPVSEVPAFVSDVPAFISDGTGPVADLRTLSGGLPFEAAVHPAGSGRSGWAQQELGDLLGPAWLDPGGSPPPSVQPDPPSSGAIWEVERMPSEAEGGVVGLLLSGRREDPPAPGPDRVAAAWGGTAAAGPSSGLARLAEMLDHLPAEPVARLTPDDVDVATTAPAPPGVWFWGDDDVYPGKVPGAMAARPAGNRRPAGQRDGSGLKRTPKRRLFQTK